MPDNNYNPNGQGNNPNNGYNPNYNNSGYSPQPNMPTNPEQPFGYSQNSQLSPQPADPFVQQQVSPQQGQEWYGSQNQVPQEQAWYNQEQNLTPQEQAWFNQPQQNNLDNIVEDLQQIYVARQFQPIVQHEDTSNKKSRKPKKHKNRKKLSFTGGVLLLILIAIIFFTTQYLINESFLNNNLPNEPFQYTASTNYRDYITDDIIVPNIIGTENESYEIIWESSHPDVLSAEGVVNRPESANQIVTLTMKLKRGFWYSKREFDFVVIKSSPLTEDDVFVLTQDIIDAGISSNSFVVTYNDDGSVFSVDGNFNNTLVSSEDDALVILKAYSRLFDSENMEFANFNIVPTLDGQQFRFQQSYKGIPVLGTNAIITTNNLSYMYSISISGIRNLNIDTTLDLSEEELSNIINNTIGSDAKIMSKEKSILADDEAKLVYVVEAYSAANKVAKILAIDVSTKEVIREKNLFDTAKQTTSEMVSSTAKDVYGNNTTFYINKETIKQFLSSKSEYRFEDLNRNIRIIDGTGWEDLTIDNHDLYADLASISLAEYYAQENMEIVLKKNDFNKYPDGVSAYTHLIETYDWYKTVLNRNSFDGKGSAIACIIRHDFLVDNAAYAGGAKQVFYTGNAVYDKYPVCGELDIMAHEFTHAVFDTSSGYIDTSLFGNIMVDSINEGYADIFGCLIDGDWNFATGFAGDNIVLRDPTFKTDMQIYGDIDYPRTYMDENWSKEDCHINSVLISHAAYEMTQRGFSNNDVARIWYQSLFYGYTSDSDFVTVRTNVERAARSLKYSDEQIQIIGSIFGEMNIGEKTIVEIDSFAIEGDRLKDNTTKRTYIIALSPIGTVVANTPIWIFEEDTNVSTTASDAEMSKFLSNYVSSVLNDSADDIDWNVSVDYRKYSPWAMNILGKYIDDATQSLLGNITEASGMEKEDANVLLSMAFLTFKFEGTAYEFFSEFLELDYSKLNIAEDGTISYNFD